MDKKGKNIDYQEKDIFFLYEFVYQRRKKGNKNNGILEYQI